MNRARNVSKERMVCLQFAVDARNKNKMAPPVTRCFSGNAYVLTSIALSAREMEEGGSEAIIEMIKQAKNSLDSENVHAYMEAQRTLRPLKELTQV